MVAVIDEATAADPNRARSSSPAARAAVARAVPALRRTECRPARNSSNAWSDLNSVKPGAFGGVRGENTLVVYDVAGNNTTVTFALE